MTRSSCGCAIGMMVLGGATIAMANAPAIDSAVVRTRIFNDDPGSILTTTNNYPALVSFHEEIAGGMGFANLHNFRLSDDAGMTAAVFQNDHTFSFFSDLTITGPGIGEAGLSLAPWWSQYVDGRFHVRSTDGEIAVFGGRLPFYSFTTDQGLHYSVGETVSLGLVYMPNGLSMADPATIQYLYKAGGMQYMSPVLSFDEGNPGEDPPYGLWGMLNDARVGGFVQTFLDPAKPVNSFDVAFENMVFVPGPGGALVALGGVLGLGLRHRR